MKDEDINALIKKLSSDDENVSFTEEEILLLVEVLTGKSLEDITVEVVGEMVDEDLKTIPPPPSPPTRWG